jgi:hypothetical protein
VRQARARATGRRKAAGMRIKTAAFGQDITYGRATKVDAKKSVGHINRSKSLCSSVVFKPFYQPHCWVRRRTQQLTTGSNAQDAQSLRAHDADTRRDHLICKHDGLRLNVSDRHV